MSTTGADSANQPVDPDPGMIAIFAGLLFDRSEGWVAVRALPEKGDGDRRPHTPFLPADRELAAKLAAEAQRAATKGLAIHVIPGTVSAPGKARAADVVAMQTVLVDLDHGDIGQKYDHLVRYLGPASLEVASGGITDEGQDRLHLYWRLASPAVGDDTAKVCVLRRTIAAKVGGDLSFRSAHQPIRVAGSVYRKGGAERLVTIRAERSIEYDFADLAQSVQAMPSLADEAGIETVERARGSVAELLVRQVREAGVDGVTRFDALSRIIGHWIRRHREGRVTREQAWEEILSYNEACIIPAWSVDRLRKETAQLWQRDAEHRASAAAQAGNGNGPEVRGGIVPPEFTDDALAAEFTRQHGEEWRYVSVWGQWLNWTGTRWQRESTLKVFDHTRLICRQVADRCPSQNSRAKLASAPTVFAVERLARADRRHAATPDIWDSNLWQLNTPGGLIDLTAGRLADHDPAELNTKITTATPIGDCPAWRRFLATVTRNDVELQSYLQRVVGYCLTGVTSEHALFFLYGTGANGKSVFVNTVAGILGDYAAVAPMEMFMVATGERHPTEMAGLRGARLVTATETEQGRQWAESKIKALTGGDRITARFMHRDFFEFIPQFKLVVAGNHKPSIRNVDEAMRRRLHLIPFTVTIPPIERDKTLPEKLLAERDGILAWAVDGCLEWQRIGLAPPANVLAATDEYFEAEDSLGRWLDDACELAPTYREATGILFAAWKGWAEATGEFPGSIKRFSENLTSRDFESYRDRRARGFRGLRLREGSASTAGMGL